MCKTNFNILKEIIGNCLDDFEVIRFLKPQIINCRKYIHKFKYIKIKNFCSKDFIKKVKRHTTNWTIILVTYKANKRAVCRVRKKLPQISTIQKMQWKNGKRNFTEEVIRVALNILEKYSASN